MCHDLTTVSNEAQIHYIGMVSWIYEFMCGKSYIKLLCWLCWTVLLPGEPYTYVILLPDTLYPTKAKILLHLHLYLAFKEDCCALSKLKKALLVVYSLQFGGPAVFAHPVGKTSACHTSGAYILPSLLSPYWITRSIRSRYGTPFCNALFTSLARVCGLNSFMSLIGS